MCLLKSKAEDELKLLLAKRLVCLAAGDTPWVVGGLSLPCRRAWPPFSIDRGSHFGLPDRLQLAHRHTQCTPIPHRKYDGWDLAGAQ